MRTPAIFCLFYFLAFKLAGQPAQEQGKAYLPEYNPACGGVDSIFARKGRWRRTEDDLAFPDKTYPPSQFKLLKQTIDSVAAIFQETILQPQGFEPRWYRSIRGAPYVPGGPVPYSFNCMFFRYHCTGEKIVLEEEAGTRADVFINKLNWFIGDVDTWIIDSTGKGKLVYQLPPTAGKWNGFTVFKSAPFSAHNRFCVSKTVIIGRNGKVPWRSLSRKEYLTGLKNYYEEKLKKDKPGYSSEITINENLVFINTYLAAASDTVLQQAAIIDPAAGIWGFKGKFGNEDNGGFRLVLLALNKKFFDVSRPRHEPQLIQLMWTYYENSPVSLSYKAQLEKIFPIEKLKALIDN